MSRSGNPRPAAARSSAAAGLVAAALLVCAPAAAAQPALIDAVRQGDLAATSALLRQGADANAPEVDGTTALHWAAHRDDLEAAELLIGAGADVSAANRYGVTPLSLAATNGSAAMLGRLLATGADANASLLEGETALMTAARTGAVDAVRVLLDHGAEVNAAEQWRGQTALMWAAAEGHAAVVRELVARGAAVDARSNPADDAGGDGERPAGYSAFLFAVRNGHLDAAQALADAGASVNDTAPDGSSALVVAVDNRNYELAVRLLERGADPDADGVGWTALHTAVLAHRPHFRVVPDPLPTGGVDSFGLLEALVTHGADPNRPAERRVRLAQATSPLFDTVGSTPFMLAAVAADVPVMRLLLAHGADPFVTTPAGSTVLMAAAGAATYAWQSPGSEAEALEAVKLVLASGVDVNEADEAGNTALHGAANRGANSVIELLLARGARLDAANGEGWMPVTIAQGPVDTIEPFPGTYRFLLGLMEQAGLTPPDCPQCALGYTNDEIVLAGGDPDAR